MNIKEDSGFWPKSALSALFSLFLLQVFFICYNKIPLYGDEAQYWTWSKELAFGYFSKPPVVAWSIWLTSHILGDSEFGLRFGSPLAYLVSGIMVYLSAAELYPRKTAFYASLIFSTSFMYIASSALVTTDPFLVMFSSICFFSFIKTIKTDGWLWWILTGAAFGLGMLSKYNMALFVLSALVYIFTAPGETRHLKNPKLYIAIAVALSSFIPNLIWNYQNDFISFRHVAGDNIGIGRVGYFNPKKLAEFVFSQFALFGPLWFSLLAYTALKWRKAAKNENYNLLLCFSAVPLIFVAVVAFLARAKGHWASPAYIAASILVATLLIEKKREKLLKYFLFFHFALAAIFLTSPVILKAANLHLTAKTDPFIKNRGWDVLGLEVDKLARKYPHAVIIADERKLLAEMEYYTHTHKRIMKFDYDDVINDHYDMTRNIAKIKAREFILISDGSSPLEEIYEDFKEVKKLNDIVIPIYPGRANRFQVWHLKEFTEGGR